RAYAGPTKRQRRQWLRHAAADQVGAYHRGAHQRMNGRPDFRRSEAKEAFTSADFVAQQPACGEA
nr:hypothetical protein [Tanacetum cinerariifolium]